MDEDTDGDEGRSTGAAYMELFGTTDGLLDDGSDGSQPAAEPARRAPQLVRYGDGRPIYVQDGEVPGEIRMRYDDAYDPMTGQMLAHSRPQDMAVAAPAPEPEDTDGNSGPDGDGDDDDNDDELDADLRAPAGGAAGAAARAAASRKDAARRNLLRKAERRQGRAAYAATTFLTHFAPFPNTHPDRPHLERMRTGVLELGTVLYTLRADPRIGKSMAVERAVTAGHKLLGELREAMISFADADAAKLNAFTMQAYRATRYRVPVLGEGLVPRIDAIRSPDVARYPPLFERDQLMVRANEYRDDRHRPTRGKSHPVQEMPGVHGQVKSSE